MSTEQKTTQEEQVQFDTASCMEIMGEMMGQYGEECNCSEMMSQIKEQEGIPDELLKVMSDTMDIHWGASEETEEEVQPE